MSGIEGEGDDVDPLIGRVFASRYKIEERLGSGAMGTVYKARHVKVGRPFAVKMLHERLLVDDKLRKRFDREAELAGKLHHINVVGVVDVGETEDGIHFMVMEFAAGDSLGSLIDGPMPARRVIDLVQQMCDGLQHAHEHGLIHRDFKPENVIIERDKLGAERPRIVDFGIAILRDDASVPDRADRLTTSGLVLGTPHYMAPEHAMGGGMDHRIDLFALGVICYELLTGTLPYDGDGVDVARANLLTATPPMGIRVPGIVVDPLLEAFTRLLMQKDPVHRPQTAKEARRLLDLIATDRVAAAAELEVDLPPDPHGGPTAVSALATPTDGSSPVFAPLTGRTPPVAAPISTPSTRAVTVPERGMDAAVVGPEGRRAATNPGAPRATTVSAESQAAARLPLVDERRATDAVLAAERDASAGAIGVRGLSAATDARAASEPGRARRAATALPHPRRLLGIGLGVGLVVIVVVIATRGGGSGGSAPDDAAPAIAIAPADGATDATTAVAIDAGVAPAIAADAALAAGDPATDAATPPPTDATVTRVGPDASTPKQPKQPKPKQPKQPVEPTVIDTSASGVAQLYGAVGRELKALDTRRGSAATSPLWPRYLRIRINDALTSPEKRLEAHRALSALRREIAAQR